MPGGVLDRAVDRAATRLLRLPPETCGYTRAEVRVPVRDGVELAAELYRPRGEPVGTLLVRCPYGRSLLLTVPMARIFADRCYNVLFVSSRGTFGSGGRYDPMVTETDDGHDVVAWMREQAWYTGRFATVGGSYLAFTQWALLTDPPPDLVAAVISVGPHDFAEHVWGTGAFRLDFLGWSYNAVHQEEGGRLVRLLRMATGARRTAAAMDELPLVRAASTHLEGRAAWYADWVTRPDLADPFWAPMRLGAALERVQIPVLLITGWHDLFLDQTIEQYSRLRERGVDVALTIGPWSHLSFSIHGGMSICCNESLDWLEEHVAGRGSRRRRDPVRIFAAGADEWRGLPAWPPPTAARVLHLAPASELIDAPPPADAPASSFVYDPADPTPTVGGPLLSPGCVRDDSALAERDDVLPFTGPVLGEAVEVLGAPVVELVHESDNPWVDVFVRLSQVDAKGRSRNVTEGYLRLDPAREGSRVRVPMRHTAHRFVPGTRIRLLVAGGSHPQFARNLGTGENPGTGSDLRPARHTVCHGRGGVSRLVLPVPA